MPNPVARAAVWMIGAIVSFTLMAVAGRAAAVDLDTFEIMLYRSLVGVVTVLSVATAAGTLGQINASGYKLHFARNIAHFTGQNLWFYAITVAPLAQVFALEFTTPVWVVFLAPLFLGEALRRNGVIAAILGFVGVLFVARPDASGLGPGILPAALAAIGFAFSAVFTRKLTRTNSITCIMIWLTGLQALFGLACAGWDMDIAVPSAQSLPWVILIGFAGLLAHFCLTKALSIAPASSVVPIDFARLPVIVLVGALVYDEPLQMTVLLGGAIILFANWINLMPSRPAKGTVTAK